MKKALIYFLFLTFSGVALAQDAKVEVIDLHNGRTCYQHGSDQLDHLVDVSVENMIVNMMESYWGRVLWEVAADYAALLRDKRTTMEDIAVFMVEHEYFIRRPFDQFVGNTYHALMLREPDCKGLDWWIHNFRGDYKAVVEGFTWSDEFGLLARQVRIEAHD